MRLNYTDARRGSKQADLCDDCAAGMPGQAVARRGRRPKSSRVADAGRTHASPADSISALFAHSGLGRVRKRAGGRDYDGPMGLSLVVGPAHAGKVALLLERYLDVLERRSVARRAEPRATSIASSATCSGGARRSSAGGSARSTTSSSTSPASRPDERPVASDAQRALAVAAGDRARRARRARLVRGDVAASRTRCSPRSASSSRRCRSGASSTAISAASRRAYRDELDRLGLWDRDGLRRHAVERLATRPRRLARRAGLRVRLRGSDRRRVGAARGAVGADRGHRLDPVRARRGPRSRLSSGRSRISPGLRDGAIEELPRAREPATSPPALAHLERELFSRRARAGPSLDGAIRFLEGAGTRGTVELRRERGRGAPPRRDAARARSRVVCDSVDRWRAPLETAFGTLGIPYADRARPRVSATTPLGRALLALLRFAWLGGRSRRPLRVPPLAVLGARAAIGRLRRGPAPRPGDRRAGSRRGGERAPSRRAGSRARRSSGPRRTPIAAARDARRD